MYLLILERNFAVSILSHAGFLGKGAGLADASSIYRTQDSHLFAADVPEYSSPVPQKGG